MRGAGPKSGFGKRKNIARRGQMRSLSHAVVQLQGMSRRHLNCFHLRYFESMFSLHAGCVINPAKWGCERTSAGVGLPRQLLIDRSRTGQVLLHSCRGILFHPPTALCGRTDDGVT